MKFDLKLLQSDNEIIKTVLSSLKPIVSNVFSKAKISIINDIKPTIRQAIESQPEYQSLIGGELKYQLGIPDKSIVDSIVDIWVNNINVENKPIKIQGSSLSGGFVISLLVSDYSDVLSSASSSITDTNTGSVIPWLEWLLIRGGDILIADYAVKIGPNPRSRTGMAIMVSSFGENYRIPAQYAGTENNNWVYRAISQIDESTIKNIIQNSLEKNL